MTSLFTPCQFRQLLHNGSPENRCRDHVPVVRLHMPALRCTWLLASIDPDDGDLGFGLSDLRICAPRVGDIFLSGLAELNDALGFAVERDTAFQPLYPLSVYVRAAHQAGRFVENLTALSAAARQHPGPFGLRQPQP